jgi:hypothetical protein
MSFPQVPKSKSPEVLFSALSVGSPEAADTRGAEAQSLGKTSAERGAHTGIEKAAPRGSVEAEEPAAARERVRFATKSKSPPSQSVFEESSSSSEEATLDASLDYAAKRVQAELAQAQSQTMPSQLSAFRGASEEEQSFAEPPPAEAAPEVVAAQSAAEQPAAEPEAAVDAVVEAPAAAPAEVEAAAAVAAADADATPEVTLHTSARAARALTGSQTALVVIGVIVALALLVWIWKKRGNAIPFLSGGNDMEIPAVEYAAPNHASEFIEFM